MHEGRQPTIGFVVSRIGGEDGVSLEVMHWVRIYRRRGFEVHIFTGERTFSAELGALERDGVTVEELPLANPDPTNPDNVDTFEKLHVPERHDPSVIEEKVLPLADAIEQALHSWIEARGIGFIHAENFTLPFHHLSMGLAVANVIERLGLPAISRGHDFPDDREDIYHWSQALPATRALVNRTYIRSPRVGSVAINSKDAEYFARRGIGDVMVIPNTIDVDDPRILRTVSDERLEVLREAILGRGRDETYIALAPVRPVARKRLDVALRFIEKVQARMHARVALLITHDTVDASAEELAALESMAEGSVELIYGHHKLRDYNQLQSDEAARFDTWDQYRLGDLACYFSDYEGWGNALLEMLAFRVPTYVNAYEVYETDIAHALDLPAVRIDPRFRFADFLQRGRAAFEAFSDLDAALDAVADDAAGMLKAKAGPGTPPVGLWADRVGDNHRAVREHWSYEVVGDLLVKRMQAAIARRVQS